MTRFTAITFIALITICTSALCAKSIFDDDAPSAPAPKNDPTRPPVKMEPEDTPAPKQTPPAPTTDTPKETTPPVTPEQAPATPAPPIIADDPVQKEKEAQVKAELALATSKASAEQRANADPDYARASAAVDVARKTYDETKRSGSIEEKSAAFSTLSKAITNKDSLYKILIEGDKAYQEAKKNAAKYASAAATVLPQKEVVSPEIANAIANRNFIEGMSIRQARQAAKLPSECVHVSGTTKIYRWYIKGRTGTFTTHTERSHGRVTQTQVPDFGVIAYVEGNFVDDKLTTFARYSLRKNN